MAQAKKQELKQMNIKQGLGTAEVSIADKAVAKFFYANGLAFSAADTSIGSYYREMVAAIQAAPTGYIPPNEHKLASTLLDSCHEDLQQNINGRDADGVMASKFGVTYTQDGWESIDHLPLINSAYITANDGGVYHRSVDTSGKTKSAEYIASLMIDDIYDIGCTNVVMVVTDTCSTMKKAWSFVLDEFPWMSVIPYVPHVVSLLMKDTGKIEAVSKLIKDESTVVSWFTNHQKPLAILRSKVLARMGKSCELIRAAATRFGSNTNVGERLLHLRNCLEQTIVDPEYVKEGYKDLPEDFETSNCGTIAREHKGGTAKRLVLSDDADGFWESVTEHVSATKPMCNLLRRHDSSAPTVGKVYIMDGLKLARSSKRPLLSTRMFCSRSMGGAGTTVMRHSSVPPMSSILNILPTIRLMTLR